MGKFKQKWKHLACAIDPKTGRRKPTKEYNTWSNMMKRCYNPKAAFYHLYGGNGITVCERWHNYDNFYEDMCPVPKGLSMDRINGEKSYYKENCRWATLTVQARNRDYGHFITYKGKTQRLVEWAEEYNIPHSMFRDRINKCGWSMGKALTEPINTIKQRKPLLVTYCNKAKTIEQWSKFCGIGHDVIYQRIYSYGWTVGQALEFEPRTRKRRQSIRHTVMT